MNFYGMGYGYRQFYWDPTMYLLIPAILFTIYAQFKVSSTTNRYLKVNTQRGYTGESTARSILNNNGLHHVNIEVVRGRLSDHYDPRSNTVRLSEDVYYGRSITSVAIAAHECGHALQHSNGYAPLSLRSGLVPVVNFASNISWFLIAAGLFMGGTNGMFLKIGIVLFAVTVLFQVITLPVEFNASSRALAQLTNLNIVDDRESNQSRSVLTAAALTYVAAALSAAIQLLRLIMITQRRDD